MTARSIAPSVTSKARRNRERTETSGIAGHRDGFFRGLKDIVAGDVIELDTIQGTEVYRVERTWVVSPEDVSVLDPTSTRALTLVTCYPFYFVGSAPERFIVRAVRVGDRPAPSLASTERAHVSCGSCAQHAAEDRELLAAPHARERSIARNGARADSQAPLRPVDDLPLPPAALGRFDAGRGPRRRRAQPGYGTIEADSEPDTTVV